VLKSSNLSIESGSPTAPGHLKRWAARMLSGFAHRVSVLAMPLATLVACAPPDAPSSVMADGKIVEIKNCPPSDPKYKIECLRLACEQALFEKGTIPPYARIIKAKSDYNISDKPGRSTHAVKFPEQDAFRYAMCEMDGEKITSTAELSPREQDW